jgi:hypothetical protein
VPPVRYKLGFYISEDDILHSRRHENLSSDIALTSWTLYQRRNVPRVSYELGFYIPEDGIVRNHDRGNLRSYKDLNNQNLFYLKWHGTECKYVYVQI